MTGVFKMSSILWLLMGLILGLVELFSMTFILLWIAVAALLTGIFGWLVHSITWQIVFFTVVAVVLLLVTYPFSQRMRKRPGRFRSRVEEMVGQTAQVVEGWGPGGNGLVKLHGEVWSASSPERELTFSIGESVIVVAVNSTQVLVNK